MAFPVARDDTGSNGKHQGAYLAHCSAVFGDQFLAWGPTTRTRGLYRPLPRLFGGSSVVHRLWPLLGRKKIFQECFGSGADEDWSSAAVFQKRRTQPSNTSAPSKPCERFSATKLGTVFGTVYRRKHSKDAEVLRLSR